MSNKTPAYVAVCNRIMEFVAAHGIELIPQAQVIDGQGGNRNWANFQIAGTEHKLYVPRNRDSVGALHTTVAVPEGTPGKVPHVKDGRDLRPGKIESFFSSDASTLDNLLRLWAGTSARLRASKAPSRRDASEQAPAAASQAAEPTQAELTQGA
jgi:hypothetical protein